MLYMGRNPLFLMGNNYIATAKMKNEFAGGLYVKEACLVTDYNSRTGKTRDSHMDRVYDWLNYNGLGTFGETPPAGGFEVEATVIPLRKDSWCTLWGTRVGTSGKVTRANIIFSNSRTISQGLSFLPSDNAEYGGSLLGRKVTVRLICLPTYGVYEHAYSGRVIVTDANTGELISDNTDIWGDNWGYGNNAMFSAYTTFYRFHSGWFSRNRYANPAQNTSTGQDFEGVFFGGAVYINPTGADTSIATRIPIQILQPAKAGVNCIGKMDNQPVVWSRRDGVMFETADIDTALSTGRPVAAFYGMMTNCANFTNAKLIYMN